MQGPSALHTLQLGGVAYLLAFHRVAQVPKGLPGYVGNTFFPLVGSTGSTLGLAVLVRSSMVFAGNTSANSPRAPIPAINHRHSFAPACSLISRAALVACDPSLC